MKRIAVAIAAIGMLLVVACGSGTTHETPRSASKDVSSADASQTDGHLVRLPKSYKFEPSSIRIAVGDTVTWINEDDFPHTVHLLDGSGVDRKLPVGERTTISFSRPGVVKYNCSLHPTQMKGQVVVEEPSS